MFLFKSVSLLLPLLLLLVLLFFFNRDPVVLSLLNVFEMTL